MADRPSDKMIEIAARAMARVQIARNEQARGIVRTEEFKAKAEDFGWPQFEPEARAAVFAVFHSQAPLTAERNEASNV